MKIVKIVAAADGTSTPHEGMFVKRWNADTRFGVLDVDSTNKKSEALRFADVAEALEQWRAISTVEPRRPTDHRPNRPLTALTIELVHYEE